MYDPENVSVASVAVKAPSVLPRATPEIVELAKFEFDIAVPFHTPDEIVPTEVRPESVVKLGREVVADRRESTLAVV